MKARERRIKKVSVYNKIKNLPMDTYDYILDLLYGLEISNATKRWICFILSIFLHIVSIYLRIKYMEVYEIGLKLNELEKYKKYIELLPNSSYLINNQENNLLFSCLVLLFLTCWNAFYFFNQYKTYSLLYTDALDNLVDNEGYFNSRNMSMKNIEEDNWINKIYSWFYTKSKQDNTMFVELKMWDIDNLVFNANLFCYFSPAHLLTYCIVNDYHSLIIILIINVLISLQIKKLLNHSLQLIKDKQILYGQVQREYNLKSVYSTYQKYDKLKKQEEIRQKALIKAAMKVRERNLSENINLQKDYLPDISTEENSEDSE